MGCSCRFAHPRHRAGGGASWGSCPCPGRGDARVARPCPTTLCVWRRLPLTLPYLTSTIPCPQCCATIVGALGWACGRPVHVFRTWLVSHGVMPRTTVPVVCFAPIGLHTTRCELQVARHAPGFTATRSRQHSTSRRRKPCPSPAIIARAARIRGRSGASSRTSTSRRDVHEPGAQLHHTLGLGRIRGPAQLQQRGMLPPPFCGRRRALQIRQKGVVQGRGEVSPWAPRGIARRPC